MEPSEEFRLRLAVAREAFLAQRLDPWLAVEPFEPILEELRYDAPGREAKLILIRGLGRQVFDELGPGPVAMEVRHYGWHLQHLGDPTGWPASSIGDMFWSRPTASPVDEDHDAGRCFLCAEFPGDRPFRGSPGGRAHFREWLRRRSGAIDRSGEIRGWPSPATPLLW